MKKRNIPFMFGIAVASVLIFNSCENGSEKSKETQKDILQSNVEKSSDSTGQKKLLSLPAPMQIANAIKRTKSIFYEDLLCPLKSGSISDFSKTLNLGIYAVDLGYSNVYDQTQTSAIYFSNSVKLSDDLKITGAIDPKMIQQFKENINNEDSVMYYTLSSFKKIHNNLIASNRSDDAYLILTGSFIEGAYLASKAYQKSKNKNLVNVIGEQKLFLDNLLELLLQSQDKKTADLVLQLTDLKKSYDVIQIKYKASNDPNKKEMEPITVSDDILKQIDEKIVSIRNGIIHPKDVG